MARQALRAEGLGDLRRALKDLAPELRPVLQAELLPVAEIAAAAAARRLPQSRGYRTVRDANGKTRRRKKGNHAADHVPARDTIDVRKSGRDNVVIVGGTARGAGQHFGWLDFGGTIRPNPKAPPIKRPVAKKGRYIYPAAADNAGRMADAISKAVDTVTRRLDLT